MCNGTCYRVIAGPARVKRQFDTSLAKSHGRHRFAPDAACCLNDCIAVTGRLHLSSVRKEQDKGVHLEWDLLDHGVLETCPRAQQILDIGMAS